MDEFTIYKYIFANNSTILPRVKYMKEHNCPPIDCMHSTLPVGHETLIYYVRREPLMTDYID